MAVRIRRTCVLGAVLVLAACGAFLLVADRAAAQTNTYSEGIPGVPFSFVKLGVGMTLDPGGDDQTLVLQLEDVPGGATTEKNVTAFMPGTLDSANVGTCGSTLARSVSATARMRSLPTAWNCADELRLSKNTSTWPATRSTSAGAVPRYGT